MKVIQVVSAATGERFAPVAYPALKDFYEDLKRFLESPSEDGEPRDFEAMKNDYCLVLTEKLPDSEEVQFSLLPMMTIGHLFELFNHGAQEPSRPFSLESK